MKKNRQLKPPESVDLQAASVLLGTVLDFLTSQGVPFSFVKQAIAGANKRDRSKARDQTKGFRSIVKAYEEMGIILSTWHTDPKFLDGAGQPLPLHLNSGPLSFHRLVRKSRVDISTALATELLSRSPSVRFDSGGRVFPLKRAFVLVDFEIPRATLIIERFLNTLRKNQALQAGEIPLLLERCCYVSGVDSKSLAPLMRDIRAQGIAFMDSVDGEIESRRVRRDSGVASGEMGVVAFAWTQPNVSNRTMKKRKPRK